MKNLGNDLGEVNSSFLMSSFIEELSQIPLSLLEYE